MTLTRIYQTLRTRYGDLRWLADTPYEAMVGAVLAQNTAWSNVEKAIANIAGKSQSVTGVRLVRCVDEKWRFKRAGK